MDRVDISKPCVACGRTNHLILYVDGYPRGAEAEPLPDHRPEGYVRVHTETGALRWIRAVRNEGAARELLGGWSFFDVEGGVAYPSKTAARYLPALAALQADAESPGHLEQVDNEDCRELIASHADALADKLAKTRWTAVDAKADGLAIAREARRLATRLLPEVYS